MPASYESKIVYQSDEYQLIPSGTSSISVENVNEKLVATIALKFNGIQKDLESAVAKQVITASHGFQSVNLDLKNGPTEEYIYLYDLENSFSIQESSSAEKYGDSLSTYGIDTPVDFAIQEKLIPLCRMPRITLASVNKSISIIRHS